MKKETFFCLFHGNGFTERVWFYTRYSLSKFIGKYVGSNTHLKDPSVSNFFKDFVKVRMEFCFAYQCLKLFKKDHLIKSYD